MLSLLSAAAAFGTVRNVLETPPASSFKIYQQAALDIRYISTGNDVTSHFRSVANHAIVSIFSRVWDATSNKPFN